MPLPPDPKDFDATMDAFISLCDVMHRQIIAMMNICKALKSDGPTTFVLPDPPKHLLEKNAELTKK